jgi:hypothetical protein
MPFSYYVDETARVLHVDVSGPVDDAQLLDLVISLRREPAFIGGYPILCNCSAVTSVMISAAMIESLARAGRARTNFVAVIAPSAIAFGLARMYQIFCDPEDARIRVFANSEEAMGWLGTAIAGLPLHA